VSLTDLPPPAQPPAQHQTDLAQPVGFQEQVARRAGTLGTADSGVHEFVDDFQAAATAKSGTRKWTVPAAR
jgi:capsular polysaccharide biosynthesis protein